MRFGSTHFEQFTTLALRASLAAAIAVLTLPSFAQTPSIPGTGSQSFPPGVAQQLQSNPKYRQWQYFYRQRAFPYDRIAPGALQAARQDFIAKWGTAPGASVRQSVTVAGSPAANQWSSIGPTPIANAGPASGRLNTIAVNPSNTSVIYIGAADGGVWKTSDGGSTWTPLTDGQCSLAMGALAIDPANTNIVYAGTGEQNFSLDSYYGCGVLRSADGGQTWTQLGASSFVTSGGGATISRILIDPVTAGSTTATTIVLTANSGIYRSTNSGSTWSNVLPGVATDAVRDPSTSTTIYAALGSIFGSGSNGIYKSTNGGQTWTQLGGGFPTSNVGRINLAIAPSASSTLYAVVQNSGTFGLLGVWKSTNGGTNWTQVSATNLTCTFGGSAQCWYDLYVYVDPNNASTLYIGTQEVYKSTDGGSTFTDIGGYSGNFHPDQHALAFAPNSSSVIYIGNDGGIWKTSDGGSTWTPLNQNLTITQFQYGLSTTPDGTKVLGGTQDNGTNLYTGSNAWNEVWGGDGGFTAIDFNTPTTFYTENFQVSPQRSTDGGANWSDISTGVAAGNALFYTPFVMSPTNSQTLYLGTDYLNKTTSQGNSWSQIGSPGVAGFNPTSEVVSAIAEAKSNSQVVYVGMNGGRVQVTTNGGTSWSDITAGLPTRYISHISVNPTITGNAFVTVSGFGSGHVFATTSTGASWTDISGNLPDIPVNTILLNPAAPTTDMFVGTDLGVFRTTDGGSTWSPYQNGLPDVVVYDLVYNNTTGAIFAATHGRGVWKVVLGNSTSSAAHDFNGDGKSDVVFRNTNTGGVAMWLMNGNNVTSNAGVSGAFAGTPWQIAGTTSLVSSTGDFNGDGKTD